MTREHLTATSQLAAGLAPRRGRLAIFLAVWLGCGVGEIEARETTICPVQLASLVPLEALVAPLQGLVGGGPRANRVDPWLVRVKLPWCSEKGFFNIGTHAVVPGVPSTAPLLSNRALLIRLSLDESA